MKVRILKTGKIREVMKSKISTYWIDCRTLEKYEPEEVEQLN